MTAGASRSKGGIALPCDLPGLIALWRHREPARWAKRPRLYAELGRRILAHGEPLLAYDLLQEGLAAHPKDAELLRLLALALARSGAPRRASEILAGLYRQGRRDEETSGILARTHKDLASLARTAQDRNAQRKLAYDIYLRSYRAQRGYYAGINSAALALLLGRRSQARRLAREVRALCLARVWRLSGGEAYWLAATLGECALLLEDESEAQSWYARAAAAGRGRFADLSSTRRQARLILECLGRDASLANRWLKLPRVVAFTGHRLDAPGRSAPRFTAGSVDAIRAEISRRLDTLDAGFGYSSAACGADILFLEEMLRRGGEVQIVLPCPPAEFRAESVDRPDPAWGVRFERLLIRAARVHVASEQGRGPGDIGYVYANLLIDGLARLRAASVDVEMAPLAVWDGRREEGAGGTASLVRHWRSHGLVPEIIFLPGSRKKRPSLRARKPRALAAESREIRAILFADVVGYSKLREEQIPVFVRHFMTIPGRLLRSRRHRPQAKATWGDALYFIFSSVEDAGVFALEVSEQVRRVRWADRGLPPNLSFRISLHAGPIYKVVDPVTGRRSFTGAHVTSGARIEPIAPPGQIYASQAFAALAAAQAVTTFSCEYVGEIPLAKKFGTWPLYHLRRRDRRAPTSASVKI